MGANFSGSAPNPKASRFTNPATNQPINLCSTETWSSTANPPTYDSELFGLLRSTPAWQFSLQDNDAYFILPNFCAETYGSSENDMRNTVCDNVGDPGEWGVANYSPIMTGPNTTNGFCFYQDQKQGYQANTTAGCNGTNCAIAGAGVGCARKTFKGSSVVCCFNDYACTNTYDKCFQTPENQRTCAPENRDLSSSTCRDEIRDYCVGNKLFASQTNWIEMWLENSEIEVNSDMQLSQEIYPATEFTPEVVVRERGFKYPLAQTQPCLRAITRNITLGRVCTWEDLQEDEVVTGNINLEGLIWSRGVLEEVYSKYVTENGKGFLSGINTDGYNRDAGFYNSLWNICSKAPLLCTNGNEEFPEGILPQICSDVTPETLAKNPQTLRWCGCHMKPEQYARYLELFNISKECTPMCNQKRCTSRNK